MTNNRGYIYVLANSAMPDLVKVGKTTRTPAERATELSKVTGVPTPFIVVYEQLVDDCTAAEEFVHTMLQQKGYRESDNREFFRAPVSEIIQIIIKMPTQFSSNSDFEDNEDAEFFSSESNDELDEFVLDDDDFEDDEPDYPWLALWEMAENYYYGLGNYIEDSEEAIKLYKQAVKLGCLPAYNRIGDIYHYAENDKKALEWYKEGVRSGNYYCYSGMAFIFASNKQYDNFHKCYYLLFKNRSEQINEMVETFDFNFDGFYSDYLNICWSCEVNPTDDMIQYLSEGKNKIVSNLKQSIRERFPDYEEKRGAYSLQEQSFMKPYEAKFKWIEENL
jgi:hypothetical protein